MIVEDGSAERFPLAPAERSNAASPQALPTQSVNIGGFTYLLFTTVFIDTGTSETESCPMCFLSLWPILALEDVNISFFLSFS